jgi:hypothetical protein
MAKKRSGDGEETISGYFRRIFEEQPQLLGERSNDELLSRWRADHPGEKEIPKSVKQGLSNVKSILRSKKRKRKAKRAAAEQLLNGVHAEPKPKKMSSRLQNLEALERRIDDCLIDAVQLDRDSLEDVINHLRRARNAVVWKIGQ